jgi:alginate O-acetyltransferase complex protein AlgI
MVFSSIIFVFLFLPIVLLAYYLVKNDRARNGILLVASLIFYAYGEPRFVFAMIGSIVGNYLFALGIDHFEKKGNRKAKKTVLVFDVIANLSVFFIFKYLNFSLKALNDIFHVGVTVTDIALPIGISFFTFQAMSYVFDVYRGDTEVQKNPFRLGLYIAFFPQLIAGPIVRYKQINRQIESHRAITASEFGYGTERFMIGFCKKVIIANNLSSAAEDTFCYLDFAAANKPVLFYWLGAVAYMLQIYFDFSGYSDMAIGLGHMFGFKFEENFNYPYIAKSVTDFWRRWHISLSSWFRDYVYIPLGGSHVSVPRHIFNMFVVWMLTGIWHGANYTFWVWGFIYWVFLVIEKYLVKPEKRNRFVQFIWRIVTLLLVLFNWVMFNAVGLKQGIHYWMAMLGRYSGSLGLHDPSVIRMVREFWPYFLLGILFSMPIAKSIKAKCDGSAAARRVCDVAVPVGLFLAFLWAVTFLVMGAHNPFIYFNF